MKANIGYYRRDSRSSKVKIKIEDFDTSNLDKTLAMIIYPSLLQFKNFKSGAPSELVEFELNDNQLHFDFYDDQEGWNSALDKWDEILDKMIWSFGQIIKGQTSMLEYIDDNSMFDDEGYKLYIDRVQEGLDLFGKHYRNLWT